MIRKIVIGGPGCGKTTRLLNRIEEALNAGMHPSRIAFVTFTRAGVREAVERACQRLHLKEDDLPNFRTLHSLCYRMLGITQGEVMGPEQIAEFAGIVGEPMSGVIGPDAPTTLLGDRLMAVDQYARATGKPLDRAWRDHGGELGWYRQKRFSDAYAIYKRDRFILDFTDLLQKFVDEGHPAQVDLAIVDEAQDLTDLQWSVVERAFGKVPELIVAGDDDQSIYHWSGAAAGRFLELPYEREVLPISHRLPKDIHELGQSIIRRVRNRFTKSTVAGGKDGAVHWVARPDEINFKEGSWLTLARTRFQLNDLVELLRQQGVTYYLHGESSVDDKHMRAIAAHEQLRKGWRIEGTEAYLVAKAAGNKTIIDETSTYTAAEMRYDASPIWHDALIRIPLKDREYYLSCRRRGDPLAATPRIRVSTIHGAKGAEADNVLLLTDMSYKVQKGYERDPDSEHRVFYVGATRAGKHLHLVPPQTLYGYGI